ncbi:MAG: PDZ domain-containing protein [Cytophagales bacterium]|nr:MAG: PDZ domain-containing protein [Cytophagales bacterium]
MRNTIILLCLVVFLGVGFGLETNAQNLDYQGFHFRSKSINNLTIPFRQYHNLIVLSVRINQSDTLNFVLDSGAGSTLISDLATAQKLGLPHLRDIFILGNKKDQQLKAHISNIDFFALKGIEATKLGVIVLEEDVLQLSEYAGIKIHGLLGADLFNRFVVRIDYEKKQVTFTKPTKFKPAKKYGEPIAIALHAQRPYLQAQTLIENDTIPTGLIIDIGAAHSLSLEVGTHPKIQVPQKSLTTFLGSTLGGVVYGDIARINNIQIGQFNFKEVITSFPDTSDMSSFRQEYRQGNLGYGILRRFHITFDYTHENIYLKPNRYFKEPFRENKSGMYIAAEAPDFKIFKINYLYANSPAQKAGLQEGDTIVAINNQMVNDMTISQLYDMLDKKEGSKIKIFAKRGDNFFYTEMLLSDNF